MTWKEVEGVVSATIQHELQALPAKTAERTAARIVQEIRIELAKEGEGHGLADDDTVAGIRKNVVEAIDRLLGIVREKQ